MNERPKKLLDQACRELIRTVRDVLRDKHYSIHTERTYVDWIKRYILFHDKRHPRDVATPEACPELVEGSRPSSSTWP